MEKFLYMNLKKLFAYCHAAAQLFAISGHIVAKHDFRLVSVNEAGNQSSNCIKALFFGDSACSEYCFRITDS